jgi:hypothetical protein
MVNFDNVTSNVQSKPRKKTMTETDSGITESYNEMGKGVGTNTNNDDITRGYN